MKNNQNGFSVLHALLIIIVLGLLGFTGWYVLHVKNETNKNLTVSASSAPTTSKKQTSKVTLKTYSNTDYGFSFQYPSDWSLATDLQNVGRGKPEGTITITSPANTAIEFNANQGGKGGDCGDEQANDQQTTRTCTTVDNLQLQSFASGVNGKSLYYYQAKLTPPTSKGGSPTYQVGVLDNQYDTPMLGSHLIDVPDSLVNPPGGELEIRYTGKDDSSNTNPAFLNSNEAKEVSGVLQSLRFTN